MNHSCLVHPHTLSLFHRAWNIVATESMSERCGLQQEGGETTVIKTEINQLFNGCISISEIERENFPPGCLYVCIFLCF